jgi:FHA domain-containing protein
VSVNGRPLGNGQEAPLQVGDKVQIGGYSLKVEAAAAGGGRGAAADPFADFGGLAAPSPPPRTHPPHGAAGGGGNVDPLAAFGIAPAAPAAPGYSPPRSGLPPVPAPPAHSGGIPADWDPFAPDPPSAPARQLDPFGRPAGHADLGMEVGGRGSGPLIPDMPGAGSSLGGGDSLDNLFGLGAPGTASSDPFANSAMQSAAAQPNMAAHADPMRSLNSLTHGSASAAPDRGSELQTPFALPPMVPTRPPAAAPAMRQPAPTIPRSSRRRRRKRRPRARCCRGTRRPPAARAAPSSANARRQPGCGRALRSLSPTAPARRSSRRSAPRRSADRRAAGCSALLHTAVGRHPGAGQRAARRAGCAGPCRSRR